MALAERAGLPGLVAEHVRPGGECGASAHLKVPALVAGMAAGADSIDDMDVLRHGAMSALPGGIRAPSTLGSHLRSYTWGDVAQLQAFIDIDLVNTVSKMIRRPARSSRKPAPAARSRAAAPAACRPSGGSRARLSSPTCRVHNCSNRLGRSFSASSASSYPGGGFIRKERAPLDALHHPHVVCAFSIVTFPPCDLGIAWSTWGRVSLHPTVHARARILIQRLGTYRRRKHLPRRRAARRPRLNRRTQITCVFCGKDAYGRLDPGSACLHTLNRLMQGAPEICIQPEVGSYLSKHLPRWLIWGHFVLAPGIP